VLGLLFLYLIWREIERGVQGIEHGVEEIEHGVEG